MDLPFFLKLNMHEQTLISSNVFTVFEEKCPLFFFFPSGALFLILCISH